MNEKNDMTNGPILRKLTYLAVPVIGAQTLQMLYSLTDMFWLGRLGSEEVAATGAAALYMWLSVAFMLLGSVGASIGVSQAIGSGDTEKAKSFTDTALLISVVCGVAFALVMIVFRSQMTGFFNFSEPNVIKFTESYLAVVAAAIPLTYVSAALGAVFTASGNSRTPFICNAAGTGVNMVLDPIFIFSLDLGVLGAAYATVIGQTTVFLMFIILMKKSKNRPFEVFRFSLKAKLDDIMWTLKKSLPIGAESFLFTFLVMTTSRREAFFGADAVAMSRVGSQIESLTWLVGGAFGSALISFVGQNFGAKKWDRIGATFRIAAVTMVCYGAFVAFVLAVPGKYLFGLFLPDPALIERSVLYMRILAVCQIPMCIEAVASNMFRGLGKTMPPAIINTTCNIIRVPLAYFLSAEALGIGLPGVWIAISVSGCIKGIWSYMWYLVTQHRKLVRYEEKHLTNPCQ
ncbi:MAG: MATE family efflux transporter [Oscillospiraceae bacterium]|nr:MATE family efflux transporter [Oscillospiraceae bacterium]